MDGITEPEREAKRHEPSPLVAEVEERLRDIVQNGAEPWNAPLEERRATRRRDMEILRLSAMEAAEDRAARIKAEAEARVRAAEAAAAEQNYTARQIRRAENKRQAHGAIRAIALDYIRLPRGDREDLFADLFADLFREWEAEDAYDGDPAETVADACAQLALTPRIVPDAEISTPDGKIDLLARKTRLLAFARTYLDLMKPAGPADDRADAPFAQGQGPPH
jgi:hypothetical protein